MLWWHFHDVEVLLSINNLLELFAHVLGVSVELGLGIGQQEIVGVVTLGESFLGGHGDCLLHQFIHRHRRHLPSVLDFPGRQC